MSQLLESLNRYTDSDMLPMHMPGHKRRMGTVEKPYSIDITEIEGFDDLHHADGILQSAQKRAADLYHSEETHYLVNGSTAGILSAISGCTDFGGKILVARNCHKSVYHSILLRGLEAVYLYPQSIEHMGINGVILPEEVENAIKNNLDLRAVVITSPTYDGIVSDVRQIAGIVHEYGIPLIVDEAHGSHFPFSNGFPTDSVSCGADVVIHSLHKTLPALTQTALIHLNGTLIDREKIRKYLTIFQTSSPSYIFMASMDECMEWVKNHSETFERFYQEIQKFRMALRVMNKLKLLEFPGMDPSRIVVSVREAGIHGREFSRILREEYQIEVEMACSTYVCAIATVADTAEDLNRLKEALIALDQRSCGACRSQRKERTDKVVRTKSVCTLLQAEESEKEKIFFWKSYGRINGDFLILYPPGIPLAVPGEIITEEMIERIRQYREDDLEVQGIDGEQIQVIKEEKYGFCE